MPRNVVEVLQSNDTVLINDSDDKIADDGQDVRRIAASESLDSLDAVECFAEIQGDKQMNVMLNELIEKVETLKLQNVRQSTIHMFLRMKLSIVRLLSVIIFSSKKFKTLYSGHSFQ